MVSHIQAPGVGTELRIVLLDSHFGRIAEVCPSVRTLTGPLRFVELLKHKSAHYPVVPLSRHAAVLKSSALRLNLVCVVGR